MNPAQPIFSLQRAANRKLTLIDAAGVRHDEVRPIRLFPLTDPGHWVSIVNEQGEDLVCIEDLESLPAEDLTILLESLAYREFVPVIEAIHSIRRAAHGFEWDVTTDLGRIHFSVENDESIQPLGGGSIVIVDHQNTRYLIPDPSKLDGKSRQKLERYY
jgi:hypothetical protein